MLVWKGTSFEGKYGYHDSQAWILSGSGNCNHLRLFIVIYRTTVSFIDQLNAGDEKKCTIPNPPQKENKIAPYDLRVSICGPETIGRNRACNF